MIYKSRENYIPNYLKYVQSSNNYNKTPNIYHKEKRHFSELATPILSNNSSFNKDEELIFQIDNENRIKAFNKCIQNKENEIKERTDNYLNYLKKSRNNSIDFINENNYNNVLTDSNVIPRRYIITPRNNINSFTPYLIKGKGSDITNPSYYDNINNDIMRERRKIFLSYNKNPKNYFRSRNKDNELQINPYHRGRQYFNGLGESSLKGNPIIFVNPYQEDPININNDRNLVLFKRSNYYY